MNIKDFSTGELIKELEAREAKERSMPKPIEFNQDEYQSIVDYAVKNNEHIIEYGCESKDFNDDIVGKLMMLIFGKYYWEWHSKNIVQSVLQRK